MCPRTRYVPAYSLCARVLAMCPRTRYVPAYSLCARVLPVPRLLTAVARVGPRRVQPAEPTGVGQHPLVLRGAVPVDAAAEVDRQTPAVVAGAGHLGQGGLLPVELHLAVVAAVGVGDADRAAEGGGVRRRHGPVGRGRIAAKPVRAHTDLAQGARRAH